MSKEDKFDYVYSAPTENERREIESIRKQYMPTQQKEDKLETLRKLNNRVTQPPMIFGLTTGIIGTLVMGLGITMVLEWSVIVWGVIVGLAGIAIISIAYPVYRAVLKRNKKKYGQQIIELSNQLLNGEDINRRER